jgi:DNA modification methylase
MDFRDKILNGDSLTELAKIPSGIFNMCVTSPPYWGLRNYGKDGQIGLEKTPEEYVGKLVAIFREVRRTLRDDGTLWLNLGDTYGAGNNRNGQGKSGFQYNKWNDNVDRFIIQSDVKPKNLLGIPWRVAFALQADGWYLRSDIIWCLSGGAWIYVKTQKGETPMMIRDLYRLNPKTVKLWNGKKWTQLLGMNKSKRSGNELELVLRSGERISCTSTHKFPTNRGLLQAGEIKQGDILQSCILPEPELIKDCAIDEDAAWLAGLYIAEGSKSGDTIQIAGHLKEKERWNRIQKIAQKYGGSCTNTIDGNNMNIRIYGKILIAIINELVSGRTAKDKCFAPVVWKYSNNFIKSMLEGYLSGDGHWDKSNNRWRIGFCRNYNLERDLRIACARLDYHLILNTSFVKYNGGSNPTFRGETRTERRGHFNQKNPNEVIVVRKARCRYVYDLGVEDEPHLFSLASGILTHNSKPNPMPESVIDRPTKSHEYIFLLAKSQKYYYDYEAILEPANYDGRKDTIFKGSTKYKPDDAPPRAGGDRWSNKITGRTGDGHSGYFDKDGKYRGYKVKNGDNHEKQHHGIDIDAIFKDGGIPARNKRSVWTIPTKPFKEAHFAVFPPDLIIPCILAGCPKGGLVLDPFFGSGTTGEVANRLGRYFCGIELNERYIGMAKRRTQKLDMFLHKQQ